MSAQIFTLTQADDIRRAGGKAYALGKMLRAGITVPDGFVVSADAFMSLTPQLGHLIMDYFDKLGADSVAVRSSAINEDGINAAWAGQLDTFLGCNRDNLLQKVEACWKSAHSPRARSYAQQKGITGSKVAVIVQKMVQSEISGVAFSVHPVSGSETQIVIEAGMGLGEAVVSGSITPDTYVIERSTNQTLEKHVADQKKKLVRNEAGGTAWADITGSTSGQKLSDAQIVELCTLIKRIEAFFGHPVDVEWAITNNTIYILQSRPITTLG
jgi:pyruvate,water dikinase